MARLLRIASHPGSIVREGEPSTFAFFALLIALTFVV